jgi:ATP-dependent 26S proteasome regulatory subunit
MITEYCILPQGSKRVVDNIDEKHDVRSMLLYGAEKSGKTAYVQAIANHLGALFINLSPNNIPEKFLTEKSGTTKLVHMAFSVAKDPKFAPVVIYLDECEIYFQSSKKKKKANAALKLQKDLLIYKNQFLSKNDRVLVVGCSRRPMDAELKTIKWKGPSGKPEKQGMSF